VTGRRGYSDRISHAFAFAAKYRSPRAPAQGTMSFVAHPANVAVILARHGADDVTLVAGILHHVLEATPSHELPLLERKIGEKFGSVALAVARDAVEPQFDATGVVVPWAQRKRLLLTRLLLMSPRALDICCADEIHQCGAIIAMVDRFGAEYLTTSGLPAGPPLLFWYDDLLEALDGRTEWPSRPMRDEMDALRIRLARVLGGDA
jgi:HD domain